MLEQTRKAEAPPPAGTGFAEAVALWLRDERPLPGTIYDMGLAAMERPLFTALLRETGGNQLRTAQLLGINRNTLRKRLADLGIDPEEVVRA